LDETEGKKAWSGSEWNAGWGTLTTYVEVLVPT
jgi:hypothetical protein